MNALQGQRVLLMLMVWIFYIAGGAYHVWEYFDYGEWFISYPLWLSTSWAITNVVSVVGGLYFVFDARRLLPTYRTQVLRALTALLCASVSIFLISVTYFVARQVASDSPYELFRSHPLNIVMYANQVLLQLAFNLCAYFLASRAIHSLSDGAVREQGKTLTTLLWFMAVSILIIITFHSYAYIRFGIL
jgi:hypothetical protein